MKQFLTRGAAAVLVAAAAFSAACSNDPTAPTAPSAARTPSTAAPHSYVGAAVNGPVGGSVSIGDTGGASTNSGYGVTWGKDGQQPTPSVGQ